MTLAARMEQLSAELDTVGAGASSRDRARIARILANAHLRLGRGRHALAWLPQRDDPPRPIRFRSGQSILARRADAIVLYEHFGLDVYGVPPAARPVRTVLDLGANVGYATLALRRRYPDAHFVCVEPDAETRRLLTANLELNGIDATILSVAVVGTPGQYAIKPSHFPASNQVTAHQNGDIEGITLEALLDRAGLDQVDLMKIDIEGAERGVFEHAAGWCKRVHALVVELHDRFEPSQAEALLSPHGYVRIPLPPEQRFRGLCFFARADSSSASPP
ncbi:MAG: FkbM family methyltransferase [Actinomycetota bacterium]|nr:FkbM family methyltransferase [Actinomycetota bacterium]